jgi:hypothetical protein
MASTTADSIMGILVVSIITFTSQSQMFKELYTDLQSKLDLPFVPSFLCCCIGDLKIMLLEFMSEVNITHPMNLINDFISGSFFTSNLHSYFFIQQSVKEGKWQPP